MTKLIKVYGIKLLIIFIALAGCQNKKNIIIKPNDPNYSLLIERIIDNDYKKHENEIKVDSLTKLIS